MIIAGTGHRPDKLGGYSEAARQKLVRFAEHELSRLPGRPTVISGMALGWDTALACAALNLLLPVWAYVPFEGQERAWPQESQERFRAILDHCEKVVVCSEGGYAAWKMQARNTRMVDDCDVLLALWNGTPGGTANCIRYAHDSSPGLKIENCWEMWEQFS